MTTHKTGTRKEWLAARLDLFKAEKEHTRRGDELARRRLELPWSGSTSVSIRDRRRERLAGGPLPRAVQLLVYHFMFGYGFRLTDDVGDAPGAP